MSNIARVAGQAANTLSKPLDIDDVFSTYLYTGTGSAQTITNGIDLDGEGGLVWVKNRDAAYDNVLVDTERGAQETMFSNSTSAQLNRASITSFNSNGFGLGDYTSVSQNTNSHASWTFRKAPKFFDVVTYTGNGVAGRSISHSLDSVPGMILFKRTDSTSSWIVWHRSTNKYLFLNATDAGTTGTISSPTSSVFTIGSIINPGWNASGGSYVAYLFAHNDGDGDFGPDGDQDIIKCGSYTGNGSTNGPVIDLGFEPQWLMIKRSDSGDGWPMIDSMRGFTADGSVEQFSANNSDAGAARTDRASPTAAGFKLRATDNEWNASGGTYIYMAIRRGPLAVPEDATEVFAIHNQAGSYTSPTNVGFPVDLSIMAKRTGTSLNSTVGDRLRGFSKFLSTSKTNGDDTGINWQFDLQNNFQSTWTTDTISWMWKRAPGFFDVTAWDVDGTGYQYVNHNLGVVPEMIWTKNRDSTSPTYNYWVVGHKDLTGWDSSNENDRHILKLNTSAASAQQGYHREFTDTSIRLLGAAVGGYTTTDSVIAYLFASCPNVSKVGSFSHTYGGTTNVDCGFTSGARFVLWKRTDGTRHWEVFDTTRGIVAGNDAYLRLSDTAAETSGDYIDPYSAGFSVGSALGTGEFIFYAIA